MVPDRIERLPILLDTMTPTRDEATGHVPGRGAGRYLAVARVDQVDVEMGARFGGAQLIFSGYRIGVAFAQQVSKKR
jgi:hypothetical protein